ncbi:MAG: 3-phosphoshikimate 1-carboxyvinyltransferase [Flavobacteriales bacterium]|nr:3-phosphoshikimate 1-carboxyvinyltransferase [Flavobacteriales bacterium]
MSSVTLTAPAGPVRASIRLPRSKSAANRALIIAALLGDTDLVHDPGDGDDTTILLVHLRERGSVMHCGAGATTFRFLLAWAACQPGEERLITGVPRLLERPHEDLVQALRTLGADITGDDAGYRVRGKQLQGGEVKFDSPISSQYLSALLLIAPHMTDGLTLRWTGTRLSEPYVHMTLKVMAHFGVYPFMQLDGVRVPPTRYHAAPYTVPADWSAAAFWYQVAALAPGATLHLQGLEDDTLQGDRHAKHLWDPWVATTFDATGAHLAHRAEPTDRSTDLVQLRNHPDLFQPLVCTCAALGQDAAFTGLDNLRVKETDRIRAIADVLHRMGCTVQQEGGDLQVTGRATLAPGTIDPQGDHRMAMALAPLALPLGTLTITDPDVVNKSYPGFWEELRNAGFGVVSHA